VFINELINKKKGEDVDNKMVDVRKATARRKVDRLLAQEHTLLWSPRYKMALKEKSGVALGKKTGTSEIRMWKGL